ncbi:MAG: DUF6600 domain-containing protein [Janthinobacterium lividum]
MLKIFTKALAGTMLVLAIIFCLNIKTAQAQPGVSVTFQTFYDELEPYGQWMEDPELGYVWLPDAGPDFKPYATDGHWVATEYGNTWVSDYDWGWAPFHYGRWRFAEDYGWEWIPGTEWGPAWVNWRTGDDYYGWAPLGPGIDIDISFGSNYYEPDNYWVFAPRRYVYARNINQYYVPYGRNYSIIQNTRIINNIYSNNNRRYIFGPRLDDVRRYTNSPINIYNINNIKRPGGARIRNNTLSIYRPEIAGNRNDNNRPTPNRVYSRGNINGNGINNDNRNSGFNNPRQPINSGNSAIQGNNYGNGNNGYGRSRGNNTNSSNGNQFPQRNPNLNNTTNGVQGANGNDPSNPVNRPVRSGFPNQPAQNQNGQPNNSGRPESGFDRNRVRTPNNQIQAPNQAQQQQQAEQNQRSQQQMQQRQQEMQQRNQQQAEQNQRNQQQMQQRQQEVQQRNQQQAEQSQRNQQQIQQRQQEVQQRNQQQAEQSQRNQQQIQQRQQETQ